MANRTSNYNKAVKEVNKAIHYYAMTRDKSIADYYKSKNHVAKVKLESLQRKKGDGSRKLECDEVSILKEITKMVYYWAQNDCDVCKRKPEDYIYSDMNAISLDAFTELLYHIEIYSDYSERRVYDNYVRYTISYKRYRHKGKFENKWIVLDISRDEMYINGGVFDVHSGPVSKDYLYAFCNMARKLSDYTNEFARDLKEDDSYFGF